MITSGNTPTILYAPEHERTWELLPLEDGSGNFYLVEVFKLIHPNAGERRIELRHHLGVGYTMTIYRGQSVHKHDYNHDIWYMDIINTITRENLDMLWMEADAERRQEEAQNG
jgi:hypothetical protein